MKSIMFAVLFLCISNGNCSSLGDNIGRNSVRELNGEIDKALAILLAMQAQFNRDMHTYIDELNSLKNDSINQLDRMLGEHENKIFEKIDHLYARASEDVNRYAICGPELALDGFKRALNDIKVYLGPFVLLSFETGGNPHDNFLKAEKQIQAVISNFSENSPADKIQLLHDEIARLARITECSYEGLETGLKLIREHFMPQAAAAHSWAVVFNARVM